MPPTGRLHSERRPAHSSQPSQNRLPGCIWQYNALRSPRRSATPVRGGARCKCHRAGAQGRMFVCYASTPIPGELAPEATMRREDGEGRVVCPCRRVMTGRAGGASLCMFGWIPAKATLSPHSLNSRSATICLKGTCKFATASRFTANLGERNSICGLQSAQLLHVRAVQYPRIASY